MLKLNNEECLIFFYEGHNQVLEERNSLKDQLSEANRKIADLENKARAFEVQGTQQFLNYQVSHGKKEKDDAKDEEIERLEGELGIKISLADQQSVGEKVIKRFEYHMQSKDEKIRLLKYELAMKDEEMQRLKGQQDRREEEYGRLRNTMQSAYTDMVNAATTLEDAFKFRVRNPPEKGIAYMYKEKDLIGAKASDEGFMWEQNNQKLLF